jgi:hypothetical protein
MKIHELAKKYNLKSNVLLDILKETEYNQYTNVMSILEHPEEDVITEVQKVMNKSKVNLIGMYYNPDTRSYQAASIEIPYHEFERLGGELGKKQSTVYNARPDFNALIAKKNILSPKK